MKRIAIRKGQRFSTRDVLWQIAETSPQKPLGIAEIRLRVKFLDVLAELEPDAENFIVEDEQHATLEKAIKEFPFNTAHAELLRIIDDVLEAPNVSTAALKQVAN